MGFPDNCEYIGFKPGNIRNKNGLVFPYGMIDLFPLFRMKRFNKIQNYYRS